MRKILKNEIGITLVALIITIILLLILAGITISQLTNSGLFEKTQQAAEKSKYANAEEKVKLAVMASYDTTGLLNDEQLKNNLNKIEGIQEKIEEVKYTLIVAVDGYEFEITQIGQVVGKGQSNKLPVNTPTTPAGQEVALKDGWGTQTVRYTKTSNGEEVTELETVATVYAISVGNGETVPVPKEFYYVGGTLASGVVISDDIADKNKYVGQTDVGKDLVGNQFVWIPCNASDYTKYNWGSSYTNTDSWDKSTNTAEKTQVQKYGGFYVGRYEAGTSEATFEGVTVGDAVTATQKTIQGQTRGWQSDVYTISKTTSNSKPTSKAGEIPWFHVDYNTAVQASERMYNTSYVNSGLITGTMYDVMLNYLSNETNKSITNASNSSYYTDLKSNSNWGNYNDVTLNDCTGRYCTVIKSGTNAGTTSTWVDNTTGSNKQINYYVMLTTGASEAVKKKNLYDVAGNLWEWTQEVVFLDSYVDLYMVRGGSFDRAFLNGPACYRGFLWSSDTDTGRGFRVALYIK